MALLPRVFAVEKIDKSMYPNIEMLNFSAASIIETPKHVQDWRLESKDLKYLDLSHNLIEDVFPIICYDRYNDDSTEGFVDLRYNNISSLRLHGVTRWRKQIFSRYKYLYDLTCYNPPSLRGRIISKLSLSEIGCKPKLRIVTNVPTGPIIVVI
ncbi:uncharacterized protein LOC127701810 [Mytilus californianus]|uniref:uncharacterized protein LOC127701810 n=1 Tax=Mytilus californianus TaxID=6549 RepID=UPI002246C308|nr:uncharacterized protein LOC127701810 [Mytilus californianus]